MLRKTRRRKLSAFCTGKGKAKVKQSQYKPGQAQRVPGG
jgi:hypothetical protein